MTIDIVGRRQMDFMIEEVSNEDAKAVIDLFNHYVMHSFADVSSLLITPARDWEGAC